MNTEQIMEILEGITPEGLAAHLKETDETTYTGIIREEIEQEYLFPEDFELGYIEHQLKLFIGDKQDMALKIQDDVEEGDDEYDVMDVILNDHIEDLQMTLELYTSEDEYIDIIQRESGEYGEVTAEDLAREMGDLDADEVRMIIMNDEGLYRDLKERVLELSNDPEYSDMTEDDIVDAMYPVNIRMNVPVEEAAEIILPDYEAGDYLMPADFVGSYNYHAALFSNGLIDYEVAIEG